MALQSNPEDQATVPLSDSLSSAEYLQHAVLRMNENDPFTSEDIFLAIVGLTGAGKSSFVRRCTGHAYDPPIGNTSRSETKLARPFTFQFGQRRVVLIDTPGFNDDTMEDVEVMRHFVGWLKIAFTANIKLSGVLVMYEASSSKITDKGMKMFQNIQELVGEDAADLICLVTTKWATIAETYRAEAHDRIYNLPIDVPVLGNMMRRGAGQYEHTRDDRESAESVIRLVLSRQLTKALLVQEEMKAGKEFRDTSVGKHIGLSLREQQEENARKYEELEAKHAKAIEENNVRQQEFTQEKLNDLRKKGEKTEARLRQAMMEDQLASQQIQKSLKEEMERLNQQIEGARLNEQALRESLVETQSLYAESRAEDTKTQQELVNTIAALEARLARSERNKAAWLTALPLAVGALLMTTTGGGGFGSGFGN